MKRIFVLLFVMVSLTMTAGCSNQNAVSDTYQNNVSDTSNAENGITNTNDIEPDHNQGSTEEMENNIMNIQIGDNIFSAALADNSTAEKLLEMLSKGPITIDMQDYGNMEKVGSFDTALPRNDEAISTEPGDLILYQGKAFVIYYDTNTWNFTRIGKINDVTQEELKKALGSGDVTVTLSLSQE